MNTVNQSAKDAIMHDHKVGILGLGYVGLTLGVGLADEGVHVVGIERSQYILDCLSNKHAHFLETGLDAKLREVIDAGRFKAGVDASVAADCTAYVITVGTPLDDTGKVNLSSLRQVAQAIAGVLKEEDLVILRSTVRIGVTRQIVQPILDAVGVSYCLAFCPERTLEGKALSELRTLPQIISGVDTQSIARAEAFFRVLTDKIVTVSSVEAAEMVKLANNTQRDLYFSFANEVAQMADRIGISAHEVIRAANLDYPRSSIARPGLVGGPCLEKDPYILAESTSGSGYQPALTMSGRKVNEAMSQYGVQTVLSQLYGRGLVEAREVKKVAILGLAFKGYPETSDLRGTLAKPILAELKKTFPEAEIVGYDPATKPSEVSAYLGIPSSETLEEAVSGAHVAVIQTNHAMFRTFDMDAAAALMARPGIIYDYWALRGENAFNVGDGVRYCGLGML